MQIILPSSRDSHSIVAVVVDQGIVDGRSITIAERKTISRIVEKLAIVEGHTSLVGIDTLSSIVDGYVIQQSIIYIFHIDTRPTVVDMRTMESSSQSYRIHIDTISSTTTHIEIVQDVVTIGESYRTKRVNHRSPTRDDRRTYS